MCLILREKTIEKWLGKELRNAGCLYYKFVSPGNAGVPDRIAVTPSGKVWFLELKQDDGVVSQAQMIQIRRLADHGQRVRVVIGKTGAVEALKEILAVEKRGEGR